MAGAHQGWLTVHIMEARGAPGKSVQKDSARPHADLGRRYPVLTTKTFSETIKP